MGTPAPATVHRVLPNFIAPGNEVFPQGCGPYAALCALHALDPVTYPFTTALLNQIQNDMIAHGWWCYVNGQPTGGSNIGNLANYLTEIAGYNVQYFSSYGEGGPLVVDDLADAASLHTVLRGLSGRQPILVEVSDGSAWADNQTVPHVGNHYGCVGGLDSTLGYLLGNGDENGDPGPLWNGWGTMLAAGPIAFLVVWQKRGTPPTPPPSPPPVQPDVAGALADLRDAIKRLGGS